MFGKKSHMSSNDKFVMSMGKKAGNVKVAHAPAASAGMSTRVAKPSVTPVATAKKTSNLDASKRGLSTNQNRPQSLGKANTFNTNPKKA